jgi:hypothetical protein
VGWEKTRESDGEDGHSLSWEVKYYIYSIQQTGYEQDTPSWRAQSCATIKLGQQIASPLSPCANHYMPTQAAK